VEDWPRSYLKATIAYATLQFFYIQDGQQWHKNGPVFDATLLLDEPCQEGRFTGTMLGLCAQDISGAA
jgi:xylan 1,4-beta-xylosidase